MIRPNTEEFQHLKPLLWSDVWEIWRRNEAGETHWKEHWQSKGHASWEAWRQTYAKPLRLDNRGWQLYHVVNPMQSVPAVLHGGPFRSWTEKFYNGVTAPPFAEIARRPEIHRHVGILRLIDTFPAATTVMGVHTDNGIVIVEGMHRCTAIALAARLSRRIDTEFTIAIGDYRREPLPIVGQQTQT